MNALPAEFFCRSAQDVAPELVGCRLVKRQGDGSLLWGVVVETDAYSQDELVTAIGAGPARTKLFSVRRDVSMCM